ncbi:MAG TPA: hypothetical protein VMJ10_12145 [Kofleriaceae bacterium]|nr:hypothetical protein [Kofleriaceae bacterium]
MGRLVVIALLGACRFGFNDVPPGQVSTDAPAAPADAMPLLACSNPPRFTTNAGTATAMVATATSTGFDVFTTDSSGNLGGFAYSFSGTGLVADASGIVLDTNANGTLGTAVNGDTVLLSSMTGLPTATGTTLYAFGRALAENGSPSVRSGELTEAAPIVADPSGSGFALFTIAGSGEVDANHVAANASDADSPVAVVQASAKASNVTVTAVANGYLVAYSSAQSSPNQVQLELVDDSFAVVVPAVSVDNAQYDEYDPVIAAVNGVYMIAWHAKNVTDDDDVWFELRDSSLKALTVPTKLATYSDSAVAASDGTNFWIVWETYSPSTTLAGAQITPAGVTTPLTVTGSGGTPKQWAMVPRGMQPVLVWSESGGTGPDLYIDPMCSSN